MAATSAGFYLTFGRDIGFGHLVRCAALATRLKAGGWRTGLLSDVAAPEFCASVFEEWPLAEGDDASSPHFDWLVVDHYHPDDAVLKRLLAKSAHTLVIRDQAEQDASAGDIVLNQNLDHRFEAARQGRRLLLGPDFALLRPAFARARLRARAPSERRTLERIMIAPGATDPLHVTDRLLPGLVEAGFVVDVVLSSLAPNIEAVARIARAYPKQVRFAVDADDQDVAARLCRSDLVIGNGGSGSWERCTLGAPSLILEMADNQRGNVAALAERGAGVSVGLGDDPKMPQRVLAVIEQLRANPQSLQDMSTAAFQICDGLGANRAAAALNPWRLRDGRRVELRKAAASDRQTVHDWRTSPETLCYGGNPDVLDRAVHRDWFNRTLADHRVVMAIIELDGRPAGVLQLNYRGERAGDPLCEASIFLDPGCRDHDVAAGALDKAAHLVPFACLKAFAKPDDETSLRLFREAGFVEEEDAFYLSPRQ